MKKYEKSTASSDAATATATAYNGKAHGELYSPDYATRINTDHNRISEQGDLYSPQTALPRKKRDSLKQQQLQLEEVEKGEDEEGKHETPNPNSWTKSSSKL